MNRLIPIAFLLAVALPLAPAALAGDTARVRVVNTATQSIAIDGAAIAPGTSRVVEVPAGERGTVPVEPPAGSALAAPSDYPALRRGSLYTLRVSLVPDEASDDGAAEIRTPPAPAGFEEVVIGGLADVLARTADAVRNGMAPDAATERITLADSGFFERAVWNDPATLHDLRRFVSEAVAAGYGRKDARGRDIATSTITLLNSFARSYPDVMPAKKLLLARFDKGREYRTDAADDLFVLKGIVVSVRGAPAAGDGPVRRFFALVMAVDTPDGPRLRHFVRLPLDEEVEASEPRPVREIRRPEEEKDENEDDEEDDEEEDVRDLGPVPEPEPSPAMPPSRRQADPVREPLTPPAATVVDPASPPKAAIDRGRRAAADRGGKAPVPAFRLRRVPFGQADLALMLDEGEATLTPNRAFSFAQVTYRLENRLPYPLVQCTIYLAGISGLGQSLVFTDIPPGGSTTCETMLLGSSVAEEMRGEPFLFPALILAVKDGEVKDLYDEPEVPSIGYQPPNP